MQRRPGAPPPEAQRRPSTHFEGVDGLRGVAAAGVLLSHVHLYGSPDGAPYDLGPGDIVPFAGGTAGVVLFFCLSAFLLYRPFAAAQLHRTRSPPLRAYLRNRLLRIVPGYWLAVLGAGLVLRTTYLPPLEVDGRSLASEPATLLTNLLLVQGYSPTTLLTGIGPAWSLAVELVFYVLLPVLAVLAAVVGQRTATGRRCPWLAALSPAVLLLALGELGHALAQSLPAGPDGAWAGSWHAVVARSFLAHAGVFASGLVLAVLHVQMSRGVVVLPRRWAPYALAAAVLLLCATSVAHRRGIVGEHYASLVLSVACALLVAVVVLPQHQRLRVLAALSSRPLQWLGLVSYGIFLWNEPVVWLLRRSGVSSGGPGGFVLVLGATVLITCVVAWTSWSCCERPALRLKRQPSERGEPQLDRADVSAVSSSAP